jgi:transcriptional regulator with XRE-family HTH domain
MKGDRIKQLRKKAGYTQTELGEKLGVVKQTISSWENDVSEPSGDTLDKLCEFLNTTPNFLHGIGSALSSDEKAMHGDDGFFYFAFSDSLREVFTLRLKTAISEKGMTNADFVSSTDLLKEKGGSFIEGTVAPSLEELIEISQFLNVSTDYLLGQVPQVTNQEKKLLNAFVKLSEDNKDIIIGKTKELLREQRFDQGGSNESVAADSATREAYGK